MDATSYYAPTFFPASYFYVSTVPAHVSSPTTLSLYNAPTYFPAAYFYGTSPPLAVIPVVPAPIGLSPYNAPTYFPTAYFYVTSSSPAVTPLPPTPQGRDHNSYSTLLALMSATGAFEEVIFGASTQRSEAGADTYPLAVLTPQGWEESDDSDPTLIVRRVTFSITVVIKSEDTVPRFDQLDWLSSAIKNVVDRSDLDGTCLPALTRIRTGRYEYSNHYPEQSIDLEGEFSSIFDPLATTPTTS